MLLRIWFFFITAAFLLSERGLAAEVTPANEYQLKAVFLYNFVQFTEWPPGAFPTTDSPLIIGIIGENPVSANLETTLRGERVNNRPLVVEKYRRVEDIKNCQVLFISPSEASRYENIFATLRGRPILTVGDTDGFAQRGGIIRFVTESKRIRFRINLSAAKTAKLTISSKLLRQAEIVMGKSQ